MTKAHEIKCHPHFFDALKRGDKNFEIRRNDRGYHNGDVLIIRKYDPSYGVIPGEQPLHFKVTYLMTDEDFPGLLPGYVVMGITPWSPFPGDKDEEALIDVPHESVKGVSYVKPIGEVVAKLPLIGQLEQCNEYRKVAGLVMPRTCAKCGLGPCPYPKGNEDEPASAT